MARNHEETVYPGGILNRINRVTFRTGNATVSNNGGFTGQSIAGSGLDRGAVINRVTNEPPVSRKDNPATKDADV